MTKTSNDREIVLDILLRVMEKGDFCHYVIRDVLEQLQENSKTSRGFITKLSEGTIEKAIELDVIINRFSKIKTEKMKPVIRNVLRLSVYQLKYMDRVPSSAICNEAVKLVRKRGLSNLTGFVNGIIRNMIREPEKLRVTDSLALEYSIPEWIVAMWNKDYGLKMTENIVHGLSEKRNLSLRCNLSKADKSEIIESLKNEGIEIEEPEFPKEALFIRGFNHLSQIRAFQQGLVQIQDISSMMVGNSAEIKEGDFVLDVCAAPGGKSIHVADLLKETGCVLARDLSINKVALINENIARVGFQNIRAQVWDALEYDSELNERADVVIADLPCSGLGVLSRKPDIKYKITPNQIETLASLQKNILEVVQKYVKPGGILIYSTCTINKKENDENADWFRDSYEFIEEKRTFIVPGEMKSDGFFFAKFRRKG